VYHCQQEEWIHGLLVHPLVGRVSFRFVLQQAWFLLFGLPEVLFLLVFALEMVVPSGVCLPAPAVIQGSLKAAAARSPFAEALPVCLHPLHLGELHFQLTLRNPCCNKQMLPMCGLGLQHYCWVRFLL
jgi:hypothetical protein